jgi:hypothetical protein
MVLTLIISNKPSDLNKKLIKFFKLNLESLNKIALVFNFEVANPKDASKYSKRGITAFPILIIPSGPSDIIGVEKIIQFLHNKVKEHNNRIANKTDDDKVDDFWKKTMGDIKVDDSGKLKPDDDDDEDTNISSNLQHKMQEAFEQRNINTESISNKSTKSAKSTNSNKPTKTKSQSEPNTRNNNLVSSSNNDTQMTSISATIKNMPKNKNTTSNDDELMAKFYENQGLD